MIIKLDWDSDFFEMNVAECNISDKNEFTIQNNIFDLIYIKSNIDFNLIKSNFTISNEEVKLVFSKKIKIDNLFEADNIFNFHELKKIETNDLYDLAFRSGKYSRFKKDPKISFQQFQELYIEWINNAINKSFNDYFIVYLQENKIIAMLTMKNFENYSQIGLIAVDQKFKGKGIGSKMLLKAENYCFKNNILELRIPTQEENIGACKFYIKNGYEIIDTSIIKHAWRNEQ